MSNIVILSGSVRKGGNTELLVQAFVDGAKKNNSVEVISVADYKVNPCIGCNTCFDREGHECFQKDDKLVLNYFKLEDAGTVLVRGAKDKGDVKNTDGLEKAYQLGTAI